MVVGDFPISTDTIVIGAGPGGYVAAIRAAQLGQKVTIVEKASVGGVCLNVGCIPSKALIAAGHRFHESQHSNEMGIQVEKAVLDFSKTQSWKDGIVNKLTSGVTALLKGNKVEIVKGEAFFMDANSLKVMTETSSQTYEFKNAIIATGSTPIEIPTIKYSKRILDSTGALNLTEVPKKIVVIGGGYIGVELGGAYANLGANVTILEGGDDILLGFEKDMRALVKKNFKKKGVQIITKAKASSVQESAQDVTLTYDKDGATEKITADYIFVMVGRRPNTQDLGLEQVGIELNKDGTIITDKQCRTNVSNIFAIGDITDGLKLAHKASYEGKIAAEVIAGEAAEIDYLTIPAVCFSDPELASVGFTEAEAKTEGYEVKVSKFPFGANGRALSLNATDGFIKLVTRQEDGLLLGAQVAGASASDLIGELGLAIETGMTAEDVALTIHAHPSLGEIIMEAAEVAIGMPIHVLK